MWLKSIISLILQQQQQKNTKREETLPFKPFSQTTSVKHVATLDGTNIGYFILIKFNCFTANRTLKTHIFILFLEFKILSKNY